MMRRVGVPTIVGASSPREEAIGLLQTAAEVEHALMIEYLFAMFSLENEDDFFQTIKNVALQEMGHLMTVQNLLLALKAPCYFGRQDQTPQPDLDPFPFSLEALSETTLAKAVAAEMPEINQVPCQDRALVKRIGVIARKEVGEDINRVGLLYAKIYWLFQSSDAPEGPLKLDPDEIKELKDNSVPGHISDQDFEDPAVLEKTQARIQEFGSLGASVVEIEEPRDRAAALAAINEVMEEGESPFGGSKSHFSEFLRLFRNFESSPPRVRPVPKNPRPSDYADGSTTRHLSDLFDVRYELMLLDFHLWLSLSQSGDGQQKRITLARLSHAEMRNGITILNDVLSKREVNGLPPDAVSHVAIGTFTMPADPFPEQFADRLSRMSGIIAKSKKLIDSILADNDMSASDKQKVRDLAQLDTVRADFIAQNLPLV